MNQNIVIVLVCFTVVPVKQIVSQLNNCVIPPFECPNENITFWLYAKDTQDNPHQLDFGNPDSISRAVFVPNVPTILLIHGYTGNKDYAPNPEIRPAYFERGEFNVISIDYGKLVQEPCYVTAALNVPLVGQCFAQVVDEVIRVKGIPLESFHVVGFSLGAHVAGATANGLKSGKFERITGLDPALPLFATIDDSKKLDKEDAKFVDVIHTNALEKGKLEAVGHVDFYVNGGMSQPGCKNQTEMSESSCNHWRAPVYFGESINTKVGFYGRKCVSWVLHALGWCDVFPSKQEMIMGEYVPNNATGLYFVETNAGAPFAKGSPTASDGDENRPQNNETS